MKTVESAEHYLAAVDPLIGQLLVEPPHSINEGCGELAPWQTTDAGRFVCTLGQDHVGTLHAGPDDVTKRHAIWPLDGMLVWASAADITRLVAGASA